MKIVILTQFARLSWHLGEPCVSEYQLGPQTLLYPLWRTRGVGLRTHLNALSTNHRWVWNLGPNQYCSLQSDFTTSCHDMGLACLSIFRYSPNFGQSEMFQQSKGCPIRARVVKPGGYYWSICFYPGPYHLKHTSEFQTLHTHRCNILIQICCLTHICGAMIHPLGTNCSVEVHCWMYTQLSHFSWDIPI